MTPADSPLIDTLSSAVAKHGREWCGDPRRCEALLKDLLPGHPRDVSILAAAVEAGAAREFGASESALPLAVRIDRLVKRLHDDQGLREDVARRAVCIWAVSLGACRVDEILALAHEKPATRPIIPRGLPLTPTNLLVIAGVAALAIAAAAWSLSPAPDPLGPPLDRPVADVRGDPALRTPPRIVKLTMPRGDVCYFTGTRLDFIVEFDEPVEVMGQPELAFAFGPGFGTESRRATFTGGSGTPRLRFTYEVVDGDEAEDGVMATGLDTTTATIRDAAGTPYDGRFEKVRSGDFAILLAPWETEPRPAGSPTEPREETENSLGMRLVKIPDGAFGMGDYYSVVSGDQKPVHRVRITRAFRLGKTEVTRSQWRKVMASSPWKGAQHVVKEDADVAATHVSWDGAVEFCVRLTKLEQASGQLHGNQRYRLPTEAEWEYACRAGTMTPFSFGDDEARLGEFAWFSGNTRDKGEDYGHEVGRKKPNPWGLYDMHGNVWEWCSDWYDSGYYLKSPAADPEGPGTGSFRVIRGGSWDSNPAYCRSADRNCDTPTNRLYNVGFRVVCELE